MVPHITTILQRFTGEWAMLLQPEAILTVCREIGYTAWRDRVLTPVTTMHSSCCRFSMATPPAAICPICRACGSVRQRTVKPVPNSRYASLTSSSSVSAARCSDQPRTTGGGMVIAPSSSMAQAARCPILLPSRPRSASRRSSGRGAAFPWRGCWGCFMPAPGCS